jgi:YVTN family beta-propeller protein
MRDLTTLSWPSFSLLLIFLITLCAGPTFGAQSGALLVNSLREVYQTQTNFDVPLGGYADNYISSLWCDPNVATETTVTILNQNTAFSLSPIAPPLSHIFCGTYYYVIFRFTPAAAGLVTDVVTFSTDIGSASLQLIGNGIPVESPAFWVADLPAGTSAERLQYDSSRHYLYVTDSNNNRLIVFSPPSRSVVTTIPVGYAPFGMALTPDAKFLYIANAGEYSISEINLDTLQESRRIILPSLGPYPGYTPYALTVIGEGLLLIGSSPPLLSSGGPIFELDLNNQTLSPRTDIGRGMSPDFATSSDFSTTAILVEPFASPADFVRYDHASGSITKGGGGIEAGVSINHNGTEILSNDGVCMGGVFSFLPDLHLMDSQLNTITGIGLLGCKALQTAFSADGSKVYAVSDPDPSSPIAGSLMHEVDLSVLRQTRTLQSTMPDGYYPLPDTKAMAVSDDGVWVYSIFGQTNNAPPSKLLMMKVGHVDGISSLAVVTVGTGTGTVISIPGGIDCGSDCWEDFPTGTSVSLTPVAGANTVFAGWSGDPDCLDGVVTMGKDKSCIAKFDRAYLVSVNKAGAGKGLVSSDSPQINCGSQCSAYFKTNSRITLTATPDAGSIFLGWTSTQVYCSAGGPCIIDVGGPISVTATFVPAIYVNVVAPNGGEVWRGSTLQTIRWSANGFSGNVRIQLSRDGGTTWKTIINKTANSGSVQWKVRKPVTSQAKIRICSIASPSICDTSDSTFTIQP